MSQAARSKSKDKKVSKEPPKVASKPSSANAGAGVSASGYNPLLGTFQTFDTAPVTSNTALHVNGRFRNIDERDDLSGHSHGAGGEYETVSNNGSWSGEEDHKEKTSNLPLRQETLVGSDNDKREKIRQKNERKHQRQKERRAQELHEKCSGYLMSRKLETLAEQLVAMGFSSEQATMALILNEGKVEESVAWLFEGRKEANKDEGQSADTEGNLKIDISEEFARIADMEIRFNCSKQDVERAVVSCEGDLVRAEDMLRSQKQEPPSVLPKPEETSDPPTMGNDKLPIGATENLTRVPVKPSSSSTIPAKRDDKDFGYTKVIAPAGPSMDPGSKNIPLLEGTQPKLDQGKAPQVSVPVDKSFPNPGSNPSVSFSLSSSLQVSLPPANTEARYVAVGNELKHLPIGTVREPVIVGNELKHLPTGTVREPVIVMQRPESVNARPTPTSNVSSSLPGTAAPFFPRNIVGTVTPNGMIPHIPGTRSFSMNGVSTNHQLYNQLHYQQHQRPEQFVSSYGTLEPPGISWGNSLRSRTGGSPQTQSVAAASSLGLFSGWGTNGTYGLPSPVDWNTSGGAVLHLDYTNIDWSLDYGSSSSGSGGVWRTTNSLMQPYDPKYDSFYRGIAAKSTSKPVLPNEIGVPNPGLQDGGVSTAETSAAGGSCQQTSVAGGSREWTSTTGGSRDWTSPFEERDLFSLPRQIVSSPSL
ncbi:uncharacterized protein LOC129903030 [Solanum dulcamara]|uniref:uncharacterized protein LOC129903030 n=1 Tax=Solanum dulcamara TaxID=45834 RepID=UPI00248600DC|nr:uncharacterized protein LOC129903030 [Solanum dulcamara]XP_055834479.1 uncharacterized protein LOC129903030 [Solanum dulcamara]